MNRKLTKQSAFIIIVSLAFIFLVGVGDALSGAAISLAIFYLIPVAVTAYYIDFRTSLMMSIISCIVHPVADHFFAVNEVLSIVLWNAGVRLILFIIVAHVLVKRRHAEEQLSKSEEGFRLLVEGTRDCAIVMLDREGRIINWNSGAERIFGYASAEILDRHLSSLYISEDVHQKRPNMELQLATSEGKHITEGWRLRKNGDQFWADVILTSLHDLDGELRGFSLLTRDMTERRAAEQTVHLYAQLYEIDRAILAAGSSNDIAQQALDRLQNVLPFQFASICILDLEAGKSEVAASFGGDIPQSIFLLDSPEFENVEDLRNGISNIVEDCHSGNPPWRDALPFEGVHSYVNVPLLSHGRLIGILNLGRQEHSNYSVDEIRTVEQVANQVAMAINSARLLEVVSIAHDRLRFLSQKMLEVQEAEKRHLARELHDEMGQSLSALKIHLEEMQDNPNTPEFQGRLSDGLAILEKTVRQVRSLSLNLRPLVLDDLGLVAALRWYISRQSQLAGFHTHFLTKPEDIHLPAEIETACFRIAQEALTNVVRHSKAKSVNLELIEIRDQVQLRIKDDGIGFDLNQVGEAGGSERFGLLGMKERALLLGGEIEVESFPQAGTEVRVLFPINRFHGIAP